MRDTREPVSAPLRRLGTSLLTLGRIRLELLAIEVQEEKDRIAGLLVWAVLAALMAGFGLLMFLVLVAAAVLAANQVKGLMGRPATLFSASVHELREDADALQRRP